MEEAARVGGWEKTAAHGHGSHGHTSRQAPNLDRIIVSNNAGSRSQARFEPAIITYNDTIGIWHGARPTVVHYCQDGGGSLELGTRL